METKNQQPLRLRKEGYTGILGAMKIVHKFIRIMACGIPIQYKEHDADNGSVITFSGNGMSATLHIEKFNTQKGGTV